MSDDKFVDEEIVSFPVPKRYLPVVIRALAVAMEGGSAPPLPPSSPEPVPTSSTDGTRGWTRETISKLKHVLQNRTVRMMLDLTADQPDRWLGFRDLMSASGRRYGEARGDLAGFTQLLTKQFGRDIWPVNAEWSDQDGQIRYRMPQDVARWWKEIP